MATPPQPTYTPPPPPPAPRPHSRGTAQGEDPSTPAVCSWCGQRWTGAHALPHYRPGSEPETLLDPSAFRDGERRAYDRVLAYLDALPEDAASRTRDEGRGVSHAVQEIRAAVLTLRDDVSR